MQAIGTEDAVKEVVEEEAIVKDAEGEAENSTAYYTHHPSKNPRRKLKILERS